MASGRLVAKKKRILSVIEQGFDKVDSEKKKKKLALLARAVKTA